MSELVGVSIKCENLIILGIHVKTVRLPKRFFSLVKPKYWLLQKQWNAKQKPAKNYIRDFKLDCHRANASVSSMPQDDNLRSTLFPNIYLMQCRKWRTNLQKYKIFTKQIE